MNTPPPPEIVVIGGGLAGLAAAAALVKRGLKVTIVESRPRLGGRASSFNDPATGESVDNCQHVSMRCCTNLADFCDRVGASARFLRVPAIRFLDPEGNVSLLRAGWLPAPLHLTTSFLRARYLNWQEKLRVAFGLACLRFARADNTRESFADWLWRHGQTTRTIAKFWATVLVSALNERLEQMDIGHARKVFIDGFLRNRHGFEMEVPLVPLGELYGSGLERWLDQHGVAVRLGQGARSIEVDQDGGVVGVTLRSGEAIRADFVVLTVPFDRALGLLPAKALEQMSEFRERVDSLKTSPITGIHFWFDRPVCPFDHVVKVGGFIQWVFNHTALQGREAQGGGGQYLQLVISASYDLVDQDRATIRDLALEELRETWPEARAANLVRWWVVTEHGATFAVRPGVENARPGQRTPVDGLLLAGDWTDTGWPATMEGAVRSGYLATEAILEALGTPHRLIRDELPSGFLARLLLGPLRTKNSSLAGVDPARQGRRLGSPRVNA